MLKSQKTLFTFLAESQMLGKNLKNPNLSNRGVRGERGGGASHPTQKICPLLYLSPDLWMVVQKSCAKSWPQACLLLLQVIYLLVFA